MVKSIFGVPVNVTREGKPGRGQGEPSYIKGDHTYKELKGLSH